MRSKFLNLFFAIVALIFLYFVGVMYLFLHVPLVKRGVTASVKVYPNQNITLLAQSLHQQHELPYPGVFQFCVAMMGNRFQAHFGEYDIRYPLTAWQLLKNISVGRGLMKHRFTIVEGWTFQMIRQAMANDKNLLDTLSKTADLDLMKKLGSSNTNPEGLFYPNTYFFTWGNTDFSILKPAYQKMQNILQQAWAGRASGLPYQKPYDALIIASMIEKETAQESEKPLISSVILNRLAKNMRLQIDPTVQYGVAKMFTVVITKTDLMAKNPYNTYRINGLPPTPICMPSESSIQAALHPATTNYLYYVANGKGGHTFSATYAEHETAVAAYRALLQQKKAAPAVQGVAQ